jgi:hypothetical protein
MEPGVFLPWVISHGPGERPNGLFIAPPARANFDTLTGTGTSSNVTRPGGALGTLRAVQQPPELYLPRPKARSRSSLTGRATLGTSCLTDYLLQFPAGTQVLDSRKQFYCFDLEGLVAILVPATAIPFYIGFNANIAQHSWQAQNLERGYPYPMTCASSFRHQDRKYSRYTRYLPTSQPSRFNSTRIFLYP